jgi:hypothetical protein
MFLLSAVKGFQVQFWIPPLRAPSLCWGCESWEVGNRELSAILTEGHRECKMRSDESRIIAGFDGWVK